MSEHNDHRPDDGQRDSRLSDAYERILARFHRDNNGASSTVDDPQRGQAEDKGQSRLNREGLQREIDEAVQFEADVENFTKDELALLRAWVERDLADLRRYLASGGESVANWLGIDIVTISERIRQGLFSVADRTVVDRTRFEDDLEAARADYYEGEIAAPGRMACVHCGEIVTLIRPTRLEPCHACGHRYFQRAPL
ncbi:zinc ribbon-containing protein [Phytohalomonas tamaricis]|uniref:zinc ribbon-containing protein n=1 Tax=Phytohalomonas tamaricis TaxID=2081032 RepID=UPI000D0BD888|nr:zinc ribbon-containing protein [Phytohalomonas tamaricis]